MSSNTKVTSVKADVVPVLMHKTEVKLSKSVERSQGERLRVLKL